MFEGDKFIKEINLQIKELDKFLTECDERFLIPLEEILATGLFDSIEEVEVFFFSFDGEYYSTDISLIRYMKDIYLGMIDELNINRLFYE